MATSTNLNRYTLRDLGRMARKLGIDGWSSMRKDQLVRALVRTGKARETSTSKAVRGKVNRAEGRGKKASRDKVSSARLNAAKSSRSGPKSIKRTSLKATSVTGSVRRNGSVSATQSGRKGSLRAATLRAAAKSLTAEAARKDGDKSSGKRPATRAAAVETRAPSPKRPEKPKNSAVVRKIREASEQREREKDLTTQNGTAKQRRQKGLDKDRLVLLVRDPYWLHACWDVSRQSVERARAAMAEHWHTARPILRLIEVDDRNTTSTAERVARDIEIHGGVKNWYIDVKDPPQSYRVDLGYQYSNGKFYSLARSNSVTTPRPGSSDAIDRNWSDVAENYEKIYALSGGYREDATDGELRELFEERLRRPMGSPLITRFGAGAERAMVRDHDFLLDVDAEMIIFGATKPDAHVSLGGDPVKLRSDGTFTVRVSMPDRRQVLPVVASSADGVEQRTVVLAVERNTKVMEPMIREGNE